MNVNAITGRRVLGAILLMMILAGPASQLFWEHPLRRGATIHVARLVSGMTD